MKTYFARCGTLDLVWQRSLAAVPQDSSASHEELALKVRQELRPDHVATGP